MTLGDPAWMGETSFEVGDDHRIEPWDMMTVVASGDPINGQADLLRMPID
jgi:hypothetical protein